MAAAKRFTGVPVFFLRALLLFAVTLLPSCTGYSPEIVRTFWQLDVLFSPQEGTQRELLSLFVLCSDEDGMEDLARLDISLNEKELTWSLDAETWREVPGGDGLVWIGGNGLAAPSSAVFPRGEYHVRVVDRAGEAAETSFVLPPDLRGLAGGNLEEKFFPRIIYKEGAFEIHSPHAVHFLAVTDEEGRLVETLEFAERVIGPKRLKNAAARGGELLTIGAFDQELGLGVKSGPYLIP